MSRKYNPYIYYTEYYLISGAYQVINVVNGILTYSASYSDNIKEYLRNQVASKQVALNELIRSCNENDTRVNSNQNESDVDEDGFVVIKMRRSKKNKVELSHINSSSSSNSSSISSNNIIHHDIHNNNNINMDQNKNLKDNIYSDIIQQIVDDMIKDVIKKLDTNTNIVN